MTTRSAPAPRPTLGIDLGTTNTVVAQYGEVSPLGGGDATLMPSALAFTPSGERLLGDAARARRLIDPRNTLLSTKRLIGAPYRSYRARRFAERHPYTIGEGGAGQAVIRTRAGDVDPVDVAAALLAGACERAGREPAAHACVITVPASFEEAERAATLRAAERAGFGRTGLVTEPVATAIAYLTRSNLRYAAVYDLGGGTFDLAVVDCSRHPFRVVAHAGDPYLGGDDVDRELAVRLVERVLAEHRWDLGSDSETFARVVAACSDAKIALSDAEEVSVELAELDPAAPWRKQAPVQRAELAAITSDVVRRTFAICDLVLAEANLKARDIDAVFLAGGSTRLPGLREMVGTYFGKRARFDLDPMHVVAIGASTAAVRPALFGLLESEFAA
jgi:molecular chaperone DnaK